MPVPWSKDAKIIEFGAEDGLLATRLIHEGCKHVLCVVETPAAAERLVAANPLLRRKVAAANGRAAIRRNNADALILDGRAGLALFSPRMVRHAEWVVVPWRARLSTLLALLFGSLGWLLRAYGRPHRVRPGGDRGSSAVAFPLRRRRPYASVRRFIPFGAGVEGFFARLNEQHCRYAVLRWFDSLPEVPEGEDVDLLVADEDLEFVRSVLDEGPGLQPIDVYSTTGLPGADYRSLPYYPPVVAEQLLDEAHWHRDLCRVPSPQHHFLSLAYHAVYHKGVTSGLPASRAVDHAAPRVDHDYVGTLRGMVAAAGYCGEITMEELDRHLAQRGWRPTHDMLSRLARFNPWVKSCLRSDRASSADDGLAVFLLREQALSRGGIDRAVRLLQRHGFTTLHSDLLPTSVAQEAAKAIRGGNWGRGPWKASGGPPVAAVVAYDLEPIAPNRRQQKRYPFLANARLLCKDKIRDEFNRGLATEQHCNVIHSSDNGREAMEYLQLIWPAGMASIEGRIAELERGFDADPNALATLTKSGRRAKVEVVGYQGQLAVKKTFKPHLRRYWAREKQAIEELSANVPQAPRLLAAGEFWLLTPYYDDVLQYRRSSGKLLPLSVAKEAVAALRSVYEAGYALIDASVDNMVVDRREGLKLFDFEFCHRYAERPVRFEDGYDIAGAPADYDGDLPIQGSNTYERNWRLYIGLSLNSLLNDPIWLQHTKRSVYYLAHAHRYLPRLLRHFVRQGLRLGRRQDRIESGRLELARAKAPSADSQQRAA